MTDLPLTSHPNSVDKQQSLFKLPIIFAVMMTLCAIFLHIVNMALYVDFDFTTLSSGSLYYNSGYFFKVIFFNSLYFFVIAFIMLIDQKIHRITSKRIVSLLVICVIYTILSVFLSKGRTFFMIHIMDMRSLAFSEWYLFLAIIPDVILVAIELLILVGLFKLIGIIYKKERDVYLLPYATNNKLFALLFALILCFPTMMMSHLINIVITSLQADYFYQISDSKDVSVSLTIFSSILPRLITFAIMLINLMLCYFITKGCFVHKFDRIPLKLLFKSAGWAYLYVLVFSIALKFIQFIVILILFSSVNRLNYSQLQLINAFVLIISFVFYIIGIIKLTRKAVRKYFGEASVL